MKIDEREKEELSVASCLGRQPCTGGRGEELKVAESFYESVKKLERVGDYI